MLLVVLLGLLIPAGADSFPVSRYPMFVFPRPDRETVTYVDALLADGSRHTVPASFWSEGGGYNQGRVHLARAAGRSPSAAMTACVHAARGVAASAEAWVSSVTEVRVLRASFSIERYFVRNLTGPAQVVVLARCPASEPSR